MARFHAVTWQDGNFERSASVLSFDSKAAREAYPHQCSRRVEAIDHARKVSLLRDGHPHSMVLWDAADPLNFQTRA